LSLGLATLESSLACETGIRLVWEIAITHVITPEVSGCRLGEG